jgi:hypothetical protein
MYNTSFFIKRQVKNPSMADEFLQVKAQDEYLQDLEFEPYHLCEKSIKQKTCNSKTIESPHFQSTTRKDLLNTNVCPNCDSHPILKAHGTRFRSLRDGSTSTTYYVQVVRKYCAKCNKSYTVLPHFLHSYKVITAPVIHDTLIFYIQKKFSYIEVSLPLARYWIMQFKKNIKDYTLAITTSNMLDILKKIKDLSFYAPHPALSFYQDDSLLRV